MENKAFMEFVGKNTDFLEFISHMKNVLEDKNFEKNTPDIWKTCELEVLQNKLISQAITLDLKILTSRRSQRKLLHIANYCYFLYTRLGDKE